MKTNKLKRLILTSIYPIVLFLSPVIVNAQKINWGEMNKSDTKYFYPIIMGEDETYMYTRNYYDGVYYLNRYNKSTMGLDYSEEIEAPKIKKSDVYIKKVLFSKGQFIIFYSNYSKSLKTTVITAKILNASTRQTILEKDLMTIQNDSKKGKGLSIFQSDDYSKILIKYYNLEESDKSNKWYQKLFDGDLNLLAQKNEVLKKEDTNYWKSGFLLGNDGTFYYLKKTENDDFYVVSLDPQKDYDKWEEKVDFNRFGLKPGSKLFNINLGIVNNGVVVTGYYSENNKDLTGCFYWEINADSKETKVATFNKFGPEFINQFIKYGSFFKDVRKFDKEFGSVHTITRNDGGIILIGESVTVMEIRVKDENRKEYTNGDIMIMNLDSNGKLVWAHRIPKLQQYNDSNMLFDSQTDDYFSYLAGIGEEDVYILFNDNDTNIGQTDVPDYEAKSLKNISTSVVNLYSINLKTGDKTSRILSSVEESDVILKPSIYLHEMKGNDIIIFGRNKKEYKFGILKL